MSIEKFYEDYKNNPNHILNVKVNWDRIPAIGFHSGIRGSNAKKESMLLLIGTANYAYVGPNGNFEAVLFAQELKSAKYSIQLEDSKFIAEYKQKINEWAEVWKSKNKLLEWVGGSNLNFSKKLLKSQASSSNSVEQSNKKQKVDNAEPLRSTIQVINNKNEEIDGSLVHKGDLIVIKCHVRYWQNLRDKKHGMSLYLLGVKLLESAEQEDNDDENWHKSTF